jgi:hypothetical protein
MYYLSHQYRNKSKSQLTSPTPAQLPAVAVSSGHIVYDNVTYLASLGKYQNCITNLCRWYMRPIRWVLRAISLLGMSCQNGRLMHLQAAHWLASSTKL